MTVIRAFVFNLIMVICISAVAQTGLTGRVTDGAREELIGASVKAIQGGQFVRGAITDYEGNFKIPLAPGTYSIEISYTGFKAMRLEGIEITDGNAVILKDIKLSELKRPAPWHCCFWFDPPLMDMSPGNTGTIIRGSEIRYRY